MHRRIVQQRNRGNAVARAAMDSLESRLMFYALSGSAWPSPNLSVSDMPDGTVLNGGSTSTLFSHLDAQYPTAVWQRQFALALQTWAQYSPLNFHFVSDDGSPQGTSGLVQGDPRFGDIRLDGENSGSLGEGWYPSTFTTTGGDVSLSTNYQYGIGSVYDLYTVLLHESGHALGLAHSLDTTAVMSGSSAFRVVSDLSPDDIAGIQAIYGARPQDAYDGSTRNDSFSSATLLNPDASGVIAVSADLTGLGDVDYYSVTVPSGSNGTLTLSIDARGLSLLAPAARVYDAAGNLVASASAGSAYGTVATISLSGLAAGQKYVIVADGASTDAFGMGAYRLNAQFGGGTPVTTVAAPSNLVGNDVSSSQVALSWSDNSNNETGFKVQRSSDGGASWSEVAVTASNATAYQDNAASAGASYQYRVVAFSSTAISAPSNATSVLTAPAAPGGVSATAVSQSQISVAWGNVTGESGYRVERSADGANGWTQVGSVGADVTSFVDGGLTAGTTYSYRVVAINGGGASDASASISATTLPLPSANPAPNAPTNLTAVRSGRNKASLTWSDNATSESGYIVWRSLDGVNWTQVAVLPGNSTSYLDSNRKRGTTYWYRVAAFNDVGQSDFSNTVKFTM